MSASPIKKAEPAVAARIEELASDATAKEALELAQAVQAMKYGPSGGGYSYEGEYHNHQHIHDAKPGTRGRTGF